jgi:solute:Na+ symporter, SSS family
MQTEINILTYLSFLDWMIFYTVALLTVLVVVWGHKRRLTPLTEKENLLDLLLMGRKLTLPMFVATLVATWYGGIFGVAQIAFDYGIYNFVTQGLFWYIAYLIFAFKILPKINTHNAATLPDLVGEMYGPSAAKLSAVFNIINLLPVAYIISLGLLLQMVLGLDYHLAMGIGLGFVLLYSTMGGFRAVVFSDIIQFFVMCLAVFLIAFFSFKNYGFSVFNLVPATHLDATAGHSFLELLSWGLIAFATLVDPNFYQRSFAAQNKKIAQKGIIISTVIWALFDLSLTYGAISAKAMIPNADSAYAYFYYGLQLLPEGLRGFFLAGIVATIVSTLDSYLFLAGATLSHNLLPKNWKHQVILHRLSIILIAIMALGIALLFDGNIKNVWKSLGSLSASALLIPVTYGHFYRHKIHEKQFIVSAILGAFSSLLWVLVGAKERFQFDEIYIGLCFSTLGLLIMGVWQKRPAV